jgi:hypothetical protein
MARPTGAEMAARFRAIPPELLSPVVDIQKLAVEVREVWPSMLAYKLASCVVAIAEAVAAGAELAGVVADYDEVVASLAGSPADRLAADSVAYAEWMLAEMGRMDNGDQDDAGG